jgi:hypothetical protein
LKKLIMQYLLLHWMSSFVKIRRTGQFESPIIQIEDWHWSKRNKFLDRISFKAASNVTSLNRKYQFLKTLPIIVL